MSIRKIVVVPMLLAALACQPVHEPVSDKDRAKDLLNDGNYDQAIAVLQDMVAKAPDAESRILLASAFAGSVGFNVVNAFALFEPLFYNRPEGAQLTEDPPADPAAGGNLTPETLARDTLRFLDQYTQTLGTISGVPYVASAARGRLVEALSLLHEVGAGEKEFAKSRAYAGVLGTLQFLNFMRDAIAASADGKPASFLDVTCGLEVRVFTEDLGTTTGYLVDSMSDFEAAYKAKGRSFSKQMTRLHDTATHIKTMYQSNASRLGEIEVSLTAAKASYCEK